MSKTIQSMAFRCSLQQFRARMQRLLQHLGTRGWYSTDNRRLVLGEHPFMQGTYWVPIGPDALFDTFSAFDWKPDCDEVASKPSAKRPPTRASWQVLLWPKSSMRPAYDPAKGIYSAGIEAYEEADNHTQVEFLDGYDPEWPLRPSLEIGAPFVEFCDWVLQELRAAATPETTDLRHQLAEARKNLQLIEERKSQYVMETDIPLQLIKCEQRLLEHIAELEQRIERSGNSDAGT